MTYLAGIPTTPPRTADEHARRWGLLLAEIAAIVDVNPSAPGRLADIRNALHGAGIHGGEYDDDGQPVPPPHSRHCRACQTAPPEAIGAPVSCGADCTSTVHDHPPAAPYPLAEASGPGHDGDGAAVPTLVVADSSSRCSACGRAADPHERIHLKRLGFGPSHGCGVRYEAVATDGNAHTLTEQRVPGLAAALELPYVGRWPA